MSFGLQASKAEVCDFQMRRELDLTCTIVSTNALLTFIPLSDEDPYPRQEIRALADRLPSPTISFNEKPAQAKPHHTMPATRQSPDPLQHPEEASIIATLPLAEIRRLLLSATSANSSNLARVSRPSLEILLLSAALNNARIKREMTEWNDRMKATPAQNQKKRRPGRPKGSKNGARAQI
jgi:hypothetical protein